MRAIIVRELIVMARTPALPVAIFAYVGLLLAFVLAWPAGVPVSTHSSVYTQLGVLQWGLLAAISPWAVTRASAMEHRDALVALSAATARRPSVHLASKVVAALIALITLEVSGVPVAVLAQQMAASPIALVPRDLLSQFGFAILVAVATVAWAVGVNNPLAAWAGATVTIAAWLGLAWMWTPAATELGLTCAAAGMLGAAGLAGWSDRSLVYLGETTT